ncbi:serine/threonine-protein kinase [Myxococcus sp. RHSTA-1-4]|uniref:serine/threonine protein kinase n=1 Tax=Myxococcus sp. RHSTA-1-4 TaxID=2874601 RepID=UPI001CBDA931|nr:serine/threonine-protein kinase [Myxococcus sp. RHSTA-1-4]MBZ4420941.1 protein kinase [Myxococcus sp. RHSTA-1-4]
MHAEDWQVRPGALGPGTEVGSWRVVERLGVGGYGAVYRVEDMTRPGDFYALKLALRREDERAEREVHLLMTRGIHPNVVRLHASGRWPHPRTGYLYFVMDWVPGPALHTWVETVNPTARQLAETLGKVALALGALHDRSVLHRDFKPEHVLIREKDGEPMLLDFGVGRYAGADTVTTSVLPPATVHLLSPEAVRFLRTHHKRPGARYEARATDDLHALGVSLYRLVTGHWPFSPELPVDLLYLEMESVMPAAPADFNRRVPRALSDIILRLLAKKPEARFQSGHEVHAALVAAVALGHREEWERSLFEWEDALDEAGAARRRIRLPEGPTRSTTPAPRGLVLGPVLSQSRPHWRRPRAVPAPGSRGARRRGGLSPAVLVVALAVAGLGASAVSGWPLSPVVEEPVASLVAIVAGGPPEAVGHEVAREVEPSETAAAAAPPPAAPTPAAVAAPATLVEDEAPVKKKLATAPSIPATPRKTPGLGSVGKALCVGATSAALSCTSAPVRAEPPSESCPPGAEAAMEKLGIIVGNIHPVDFPGTRREYITVREGYTEVEVVGYWYKMKSPTRLRGRLIIGETRVYGRMTEALTPDGERIPVCMQLLGNDKNRGFIRQPGGGPDTARVFSVGSVRAVDRFE